MSHQIVSLQAENFKRLKAVRIDPAGNVVTVAGANDQGKSSVLDAIEVALRGGKAMPPDPVRHGQAKAKIVADLGDLIVTRTMTRTGDSLVVKPKGDGAKALASPQAVLDRLLGPLSFDPGAFARMKAAEQAALLRRVAGIDTTELDARRQATYDKRRDANRDAQAATVRARGMAHFEEAPDAEVSIKDLTEQLSAAERTNNENRHVRDSVDHMESDVTACESIRAMKSRQVDEAKAHLDRLNKELTVADEKCKSAKAEADKARAGLESLQDVDAAPIRARIADAEGTNAQVRTNAAWAKAAAEAKTLTEAAAKLDADLQKVDADRAKMLDNAKFPIAGLGLSDAGVTWNGVPFEQASQSERIKASMAMAIAMNPDIKIVLIRDGALLDKNSLKIIADMAEKAGVQCWVEQVEEGRGAGVVIEDGSVKEVVSA